MPSEFENLSLIMVDFAKTEYHLKSLCCNTEFKDSRWNLDCPKDDHSALIRAIYKKKQITIRDEYPGLYRFADWIPVERLLEGSGSPITYKSEGLSKVLGLDNLYVTFSGYWPEKGANMRSGTFKECEAFVVCARSNKPQDKIMVVASAGNTARAFARVCSENKIPLLLFIPEDNLKSLYFSVEIDPCVKIVASESGSDYFDAIHLSNIACELEMFYPEGGAKNVARRDGMGTTTLSAITTIGEIPDYYFQAIGSGTGAISAWEANLRIIEDGRYGNKKMRLMVSQNIPFVPMKDAWDSKSRQLFPLDGNTARKQVEEIDAKVLSNRKPTYEVTGGLFDALTDTKGDILGVTNEDARKAAQLFLETEGNDLEPAAAVATASLIQAVEKNMIDKNKIIMLNITGGGKLKFQNENTVYRRKPDLILPIHPDPEIVKRELLKLFNR